MILCLYHWVLPGYICGEDKLNFITFTCLLYKMKRKRLPGAKVLKLELIHAD